MSLLLLREAVVTQLRNALGKLTVDPHPGRFDLAELDRYATGTPTVRVAITSVSSLSDDVDQVAECQMAAFIISRADRSAKADERAFIIAHALMMAINGQNWNVTGAGTARELRWQNLYGSDNADKAVHLSAVTWRQPLQLVQDLTELPDFEQLVARYDLGPDPDGRIEAEDHIPLQQEEP